MSAKTVTDGQSQATADELVPGRLYVMTEGVDKNGHLREVPRNDDDLPRLRITEEALAAVRLRAHGMRKDMGGYRPDITMVASALLEWAAAQPEASSIVRNFAIAKFQSAQPNGAAHEKAMTETENSVSDNPQVTRES
ncbi:MAG: hypothetical protein OEU26_15165 [Candidatus Tectomicrobia bacterium]|nr:hypothetical protein [Candidatus Tectomicrobia bacterium]